MLSEETCASESLHLTFSLLVKLDTMFVPFDTFAGRRRDLLVSIRGDAPARIFTVD